MDGDDASGRLIESSTGHSCVDLLVALERSLRQASEAFPAAGPPRQAVPDELEDAGATIRRLASAMSEPTRAVASRWAAEHRRFNEAVGQVELLNHTHRHEDPKSIQQLSLRLRAMREARERLEALSAELRAAIVKEIDTAGVASPHA